MIAGALPPCPRPLCGGAGSHSAEEGWHAIRCRSCGFTVYALERTPGDVSDLLRRWGDRSRWSLESLPAALRDMADRAIDDVRWRLLDAAALLEELPSTANQQRSPAP
jgi:hypothetical protein